MFLLHKKRAKLLLFFEIYKFIRTFAENLLKMIIGLLISLLSVTYTVASSNTVNTTGTPPPETTVSYSRTSTTGQKGQMTAGNSTTLQLTGWDGCMIHSVVLSMRSNQSNGAGDLVMTIGERGVWNIADASFADDIWNGAYSTEWVDITGVIEQKVGEGEVVEIKISASVNSLYVNSYTINYTLPSPEKYTVSLMSGLKTSPDILQEDIIGGGVVLPSGIDTLEWHFLGWSDKEILNENVSPALFVAGERYFPHQNCTLWAVYSDSQGLSQVYDCQSGDYVIVSEQHSTAMSGVVDDKQIATIPVSMMVNKNGIYELLTGVQDEMIYHIDFMEDSTLTINHISTNQPIGYDGNKLSNKQSIWNFRLLQDSTFCFYYLDNPSVRMLWMGYGVSGSNVEVMAYSIRVEMLKMIEDGLLLFPAHKTNFTSWPLGKLDAIENVYVPNNNNREYKMNFGNYTFYIKDGKKMLLINK